MALSQERTERAIRILASTFGTPSNQQRGFSDEDTAVFSAATFLAARMAIRHKTAQSVVRKWYATHGRPGASFT